MRLFARLAVASIATVAMTVSAFERPAHADALTAVETARLERGETVTREQTVDREDRRYVGGVTYTVLGVSAAELTTLLEDVSAYRHLLPRTKRARHLGTDHGDTLVELVQGNALYEATYTIRLRRTAGAAGREVRFWLEPTLPHEIDDAWGFFRIEPFVSKTGEPQVLLTYGVLVDVGPGIVRELFEERVRTAMLSVPQLVRRYVQR